MRVVISPTTTWRDATNRVANVLKQRGVGGGEVVATLAGRIPGLYIAALGTLKNRCVYTPLFSAFGPDPIVSRMTIARARVLVTTDTLYRKKVEPVRARMRALEHVLLVRETAASLPPGTHDLNELLDAASAEFAIPATDAQDLALIHFTSGTTGTPKGAMHVHEAVVAHQETARLALDFHPGDRFWCTADPGWVTGTSYGIIAPLTHGLTMIVDEADFDAERWYRIIQEEHVSVWYTAPTAGGAAEASRLRFSPGLRSQHSMTWTLRLRRVCSAEVPMPYPKHLEDAAVPQPEPIVDAVRTLMPAGASS